jgi:hypothetical protein
VLEALARLIRRQIADPRLEAEYSEDLDAGRLRSRGSHLRLPGVDPDAVPWPPKGGVSRAARSWLTPTRFRG